MTRIVFFGLDGRYSTVLLEALCRAELRPSLVVVGGEPHTRRGWREATLRRAGGNWWQRALGGASPRVDAGTGAIDLCAGALGLGIDALEVWDPGSTAVLTRIAERKPSCYVVAGFHRLLPPSVLALAERGGLNVHPGRLPEERGPAPLFWMLKAGRTEGSVTLHVLDAGEDSGDVVAEASFRVTPGMSGREALEQAAFAAAPHLVRSVRALLAGDLVRTRQVEAKAGRCPRPTAKDCRVDPTLRAEQVYTYVAGCAGSHPVFVECGGDRFFIGRATSYDEGAEMSAEYLLTGDRLLLRCNPGLVELELKPGGALFTAEYEEETGPEARDLRG